MEYVLAGIAGVAVVGMVCVAIYAIRAIRIHSTQAQENLLAATNLGAAGLVSSMREQIPVVPREPVQRKSLN